MRSPITRRLFLTSLVLVLLLPAKPARANDDGWTRLGTVKFNSNDSKEKNVVASILRGGWRFMKIKVASADAKIDAVSIAYGSGKDVDVKVSKDIKAGQESRALALHGDDRPLRKIKIKAHSGDVGADTHLEVWVKQ